MHIIELSGTEDKLYRLVGPLVMDPAVLKQNYNFPFRTSTRFVWFVAKEDFSDVVLGFLPVECKRSGYVINNYYIRDKNAAMLTALLERVLSAFSGTPLEAVAFREDADTFRAAGFTVEKEWTRYIRMRKEPRHGSR